MADLLLADRFNNLPHPLFVRMCGGGKWPIHDVDVETGLMRLDVIGRLEISHFGEAAAVFDADGTEYCPDAFYNEKRK